MNKFLFCNYLSFSLTFLLNYLTYSEVAGAKTFCMHQFHNLHYLLLYNLLKTPDWLTGAGGTSYFITVYLRFKISTNSYFAFQSICRGNAGKVKQFMCIRAFHYSIWRARESAQKSSWHNCCVLSVLYIFFSFKLP